ncbi:hypothetical protein L1887_07691 [Cichorium endivia]|nr:hypothetical protein L1887_07691 [Cichorium endivia]
MAESSPPPPSFSAVIDRPTSGTQYQPHVTAIDDHNADLKRLPTFNDVAPGIGKSYKDAPVGTGFDNRVPVAVIPDGPKVLSVGDFAGARKNTSIIVGEGESSYEGGKIPTHSGVRPINGDSGYQGGYPFSSGPKSYNGQHFGQH